MNRDLFYRRFNQACAKALESARARVTETLPDGREFRVAVQDPVFRGFTFFPEDREGARYLTPDEAVDLLWRDGTVPRSVSITPFGETEEVTRFDIVAYAPFAPYDATLTGPRAERAPFQWPVPPSATRGMERRSVYQSTMCRTLEELRCAMGHADRIRSLSVQGSAANDDVLARVLGSPTVTDLSLTGPLRGRALQAIGRFPALDVLRLALADVDAFSFADLPHVANLELLAVGGLPRTVGGVDALQRSARSSLGLTLTGSVDVELESPLELERVRELCLRYPHVPRWAVPGDGLEWLTVQAFAASDDEVRTLLATTTRRLRHLDLSGTPVTDAIVEDFSRFTSLEYLDLGGTRISKEAVARLRSASPKLVVNGRTQETAAVAAESTRQPSA